MAHSDLVLGGEPMADTMNIQELDVEELLRQAGALQPRYLNVAQASRYSSLSQKSIRRLISNGKLKAHRPGRRILIDRLALDSAI